MFRYFGFILAILAAVGLMLTPAYADPSYQSDTQTVWVSNGGVDCLRTQATIQSGYEDYWSMSASAQAGTMGGGECFSDRRQVADSALATYLQLWRWDGSQWNLCEDTGSWSYNDAPTSTWEISDYGGYGPCGGGWYGTMGYGANYDDGSWQGYQSGVWSGYVWLNQDPNVQSATVTNLLTKRTVPATIPVGQLVPTI